MTRIQAGWNKAKQESLERDEFRCVLTDVGSELTTLETHHIIPYRVCKKHESYNLITLSDEIHKMIHKKCKIHGVKNNIMTKTDKKCLLNRYRDYLFNPDDMDSMLEFMDWLNKRPIDYKPFKTHLMYHTKYLHKIYEMGFGAYLNLYFKGNGEVVLSYEIVRICDL